MMSFGRAWPRLLAAGALAIVIGFLLLPLGWEVPSRLLRAGGELLLVWAALDARAAQFFPVLSDFVGLGRKRALPITRSLVALVAAIAVVLPWVNQRLKTATLGTALPITMCLVGAVALLELGWSARSLSAREATIGGGGAIAALSAGTLLGAWGAEPTGGWWWVAFAVLIASTVLGGIGYFAGPARLTRPAASLRSEA